MHDQSEESLRDLAASALRYGGLALVVLAAGTLLLTILTEQAGIPQLPAKLIVEPIMFLFSFFVQKLYVFKNPDYSSTKEAKTCFVNINGSFFPHF
ncbi:MAG: GtrA family protein, partial [Lachnospiraceae bacterium]|nr:GtrA family protein [Lachnospiraceae bacterium]